MTVRRLLAAWPVVVLVVAAVDAVLARVDHANQPFERALYLHACLLWGVFALVALLPAALAARVLRLRAPDGAGSPPTLAATAAALAFWTLVPVAAHQVLDRHTALGQNVAALATPRPWLEVAAATGALALGLWVLGRGLRSAPGWAVGGLLPALAVAAGLFLPARETPGGPHVGVPATAKGPNVLFLVWDTTRSDHTTFHGYPRDTTPALARLADESLVFEEARSVSVFTFTSHVSMLTGLYPSATGAQLFNMRVDPDLAESVAIRLNDAGYRTGAFVGTSVLSATTGIQRGFEVYDDVVDPQVTLTRAWRLVHDVQAVLDKLGWRETNGQPHWFEDFQRPAGEVLERALAWIRRDDPRPWFCFVNLYDVHWPYVPERAGGPPVRDYDGPLDGYLFRSDAYPEGYEPGPEDGRHVADLYDAEMWELDRRVDAFLRELDLDRTDTALLVTSDHGEAFGEGGRYQHEDVLEPQVRVPLLIRMPGEDRPTGRRSGPVSGVDVAPTLLAMAGLDVPDGLHGVDLLSAGELEPERPVLVEDRDQRTTRMPRFVLYRGPWKLVRSGRDEHRSVSLFDLREDPDGLVDVAALHPERVADLERLLDETRGPWASIDEGVELRGLGASADALNGLGYLESAEEP